MKDKDKMPDEIMAWRGITGENLYAEEITERSRGHNTRYIRADISENKLQSAYQDADFFNRENINLRADKADHAPSLKDEWKPIETAPRDGTSVLLFDTSLGVVEGWYCQGEWHETINGREYTGSVWVIANDAISIEVEECPDKSFCDGSITHWMPLPSPPKSKDNTNDK